MKAKKVESRFQNLEKGAEMDCKKVVTKKEFVLKDVTCYHYPCGRCGAVEFLPQVIAKTFGKIAPNDWFCVAVNDEKSYYCPKCAREIGIGI